MGTILETAHIREESVLRALTVQSINLMVSLFGNKAD